MTTKQRWTAALCALTFINVGLLLAAGRANVLTWIALVLAVVALTASFPVSACAFRRRSR